MTFNELDIVRLARSIPGEPLEVGAMGTVVMVHNGGKGYEVEFFGTDGDTLAVLTVLDSELEGILDPVKC